MIDLDTGTRTLHIYTDASGAQTSRGIGVGVVVLDMYEDKIIFEFHAIIGTHKVVYNGEVEAIAKAMKIVSREVNYKDFEIKIFYDNQAALQRLKSTQKSQVRPSNSELWRLHE